MPVKLVKRVGKSRFGAILVVEEHFITVAKKFSDYVSVDRNIQTVLITYDNENMLANRVN